MESLGIYLRNADPHRLYSKLIWNNTGGGISVQSLQKHEIGVAWHGDGSWGVDFTDANGLWCGLMQVLWLYENGPTLTKKLKLWKTVRNGHLELLIMLNGLYQLELSSYVRYAAEGGHLHVVSPVPVNFQLIWCTALPLSWRSMAEEVLSWTRQFAYDCVYETTTWPSSLP